MSSELLVEGHNLSKVYLLYDRPQDRLKQMVLPRIRRLLPPILHGEGAPRHREFWALQNVSVHVKRGETLGIVGQNGSGKSTLLQIICGTLTPTSGTRRTSGRVAALLELGAGFNPDYTGRENVYLNAALYGLRKNEVDARMQRIIEFAEIGRHIDQPVKTYSSGMFVRLAFSVIANVDAEVLIIDEALAVGDAYFQQKCMRFLRNFQERGAIFFVSHDTAAMMTFCDRVIWLDHGNVRGEGEPRQVCEEYLGFLYEKQTNAERHTNGGAAGKSIDPLGKAGVPESPVQDEAPSFNSDSRSFGDGGAEIIGAQLVHRDSRPLSIIGGGESVQLTILFRAKRPLKSVICGFIVKDRLGQYLFGTNTFMVTVDHPLDLSFGQIGRAHFGFTMPLLAPGTYTVALAVASGTLHEHVQHHWMHDGLVFSVHSDRQTGVLLDIPMDKIDLAVQPEPDFSTKPKHLR
jgi:lipopolysaccharide transport system ATP-binding protein